MSAGLPAGYSIREMTAEEFGPVWREHSSRVFGEDGPMFFIYPHLSEAEQRAFDGLNDDYQKLFKLRLGVFHGDQIVGWHFGDQGGPDMYYMRNSAILEEHRRKGLYTALLREVLARLTVRGFQRITSRHYPDNNSVIIPKLQAGFVISGLEVDDKFGTLVALTYYPKELRRKVFAHRTGFRAGDPDVEKAFTSR